MQWIQLQPKYLLLHFLSDRDLSFICCLALALLVVTPEQSSATLLLFLAITWAKVSSICFPLVAAAAMHDLAPIFFKVTLRLHPLAWSPPKGWTSANCPRALCSLHMKQCWAPFVDISPISRTQAGLIIKIRFFTSCPARNLWFISAIYQGCLQLFFKGAQHCVVVEHQLRRKSIYN